MENKNAYEQHELGFNRTQLYKEHTHPHHIRQSAVIAVMEFCKLNQLRLNTKETFALVNKYVLFIETGDTKWAEKVDEYLIKKYEDL